MTTIKEIMDSLPAQDRQLLNYAFEHGLEQHVRLPGSKYLGVNIRTLKNLKAELSAGLWSYGNIVEEGAKS